MKKSNIVGVGISLLVVMLTIGLVGCPQAEDNSPAKKTEAVITEITVGEVEPDKIPEPITLAQWNNADYDLADADYGTLAISSLSELEDAAIAVTASEGARVLFGISAGAVKPENFQPGDTVTLIDEQYLYVEVRSEDANTTNYYRFIVDLELVDAQTPNISVQPAGGDYSPGSTISALSVTAAVTDGGTLTYQWYKATGNNVDGTAIPTATVASYTPTDTELGTYYYYVVVTNTNNAVNGTKTATVTSSYAQITIQIQYIEKITLLNGAFALFEFNLPDGSTWSDYTKITADYKLDAANIGKAVRAARLYGNYEKTQFPFNDTRGIYLADINGTNMNGQHIVDNTSASLTGKTADTWFTVEYSIDGTKPPAHADFSATFLPADDALGPFYYCLGFSGNDGAGNEIVQLVRNVTLSNADGTKKVVSMGSGFDAPAFIGYNVDTTSILAREVVE